MSRSVPPRMPREASGTAIAARQPRRASRRSIGAFVVLCAVCAVVVGVTVVRAIGHTRVSDTAQVRARDRASRVEPGGLLFRSTAQELTFGHLAVRSTEASAARRLSDLRCSRAAYAAGRGVCLTVKRNFISSYSALVFNERFDVVRTVQLAGIPSRVRVSPNGRVAATTVFVLGHSYAEGKFSTSTAFIDLASGKSLGEMDRYTVIRDGNRISAVDFNFWGVTFVDDKVFYATLGTGGRTYLIKGDVQTRTATVQQDNVECPSVAPDGRRIAYKKSVSPGLGPVRWRLAVLDLATGREQELAETRSVDDQVTWLDGDRILYGLTRGGEPIPSTDDGQSTFSTDIWAVRADGGGEPKIYLPDASSPIVIAPGSAPQPR